MLSSDEYIYGIRPVIEAIQAGRQIDKIFIQKELQGELVRDLFDAVKRASIVSQRVPAEKIDRIIRSPYPRNHQGVLAILSAITYASLRELVPQLLSDQKVPFLVMLDGLTDVRNFGAIARTAECAGADAIVIPSRESVGVNADAIKTSAGALNILPVCREKSMVNSVKYLRDNGIKVVCATEKAEKDYTTVDYTDPVAIVMGNEYEGISEDVLRFSDERVSIPVLGSISSLNVSVAAGVLIYEVVRQRLAAGQDVK